LRCWRAEASELTAAFWEFWEADGDIVR
jgi:hypothetical protein